MKFLFPFCLPTEKFLLLHCHRSSHHVLKSTGYLRYQFDKDREIEYLVAKYSLYFNCKYGQDEILKSYIYFVSDRLFWFLNSGNMAKRGNS